MPELDEPLPTPAQNADFRAIAQRLLKPEKTMPGYDEGWNDALYSLLDILDATHSDGVIADG